MTFIVTMVNQQIPSTAATTTCVCQLERPFNPRCTNVHRGMRSAWPYWRAAPRCTSRACPLPVTPATPSCTTDLPSGITRTVQLRRLLVPRRLRTSSSAQIGPFST
uniref:(northern house mosquito) hypothetical protein n=1 Tax=Culex pipiens TaxID=7175 RepID=A0A8D8AW98_CULPI